MVPKEKKSNKWYLMLFVEENYITVWGQNILFMHVQAQHHKHIL